MRVFSKEMFIKDNGLAVYEKCREWVDACDGKRVIGGEVDGYLSDKAWEKAVDAK